VVADQGYVATLEGFLARFDDLATKLNEALNADDEIELGELVDDLRDLADQVREFIAAKRNLT
jgi:hypothetical protein